MTESSAASAMHPVTLYQVLVRQSTERPDAEALVTTSARLTYRELRRRTELTARALIAAGVQRGDHVGIMMGNDEHWVELFFGAATIGAVTIPINTRFKAAELAFCLKQADVKLLALVDRFLGIDFASFLREAEPAVDDRLPGSHAPLLQSVVVIGADRPASALDWSSFVAAADQVDDATLAGAIAAVDPFDPLLMQFTSGTTAYPKGVLLTHDNMLRNAFVAGGRIGIAATDRYFNCRPFYHVAGTTMSLLMSTIYGACLVTLPAFEAGAALEMLERERCTFTSGNDTLYQLLMGHVDFPKRKLHLRGGWAAAGPETMRKIIDVLGMKTVCTAYGLSEASPNVAINDWREPEPMRVNGLPRPLPGVEVRIADPATNAPLGPDTQGEIQVRGWNVMRGYYNNPDATAKALMPDGWLRTGDLGTLTSDGRLRLVGRLKDVFRVGGENVAPAEVEEVLLAHPAVQNAQVVGVPDSRLGEVGAGFVTLRAGMTVAPETLIDWCKARSANFRVPRYVRIVDSFEAIGMTGSGKVQKNKLRDHAIEVLGLGAQ